MNILSIQSRVAVGHVGNSAAQFALQRLGHEVWALDTATLSNHPAHPTWRGRTTPEAELRALVDGVGALGVLRVGDALLSGYLGTAENGAVILDAVRRTRAANPKALYCCDPVMGDRGKGLYVRPEIPGTMARLVAEADILLPNAFELEQLTGCGTDTLTAALDGADRLRQSARSPVCVLTSLAFTPDALGTLAVSDAGTWLIETPRLDRPAHGAGDAFAALFLGSYLSDRDVPDALARAVSAIFAVLQASSGADLALITEQEALTARPSFAPRQVR